MSERTVFSSTILVEKSPVESSNIFLSRLLESKGLNNQIGSFLFDYMMINKHYATKLRKILDTKGQNLNKSIEHYIKKETNHDSKYENATSLSDDHLGEFSSLWKGVIGDIREEVAITETFCESMEKQLISPLKKCFDINKNKKYSKMLDSISEMGKEAEEANDYRDTWALKSPQVCEQFENFEFNRLLFLKDAFISFQSNLNYRFNENLKHNENLFSVLVSFNPDDEIARFANSAVKNSKPLPPIKVKSSEKINTTDIDTDVYHNDDDEATRSPPVTKRVSSRPTIKQEIADISDFQPPLHTQKSNPSTINSQVTEKRRSTIRSKVGTLFGKRKSKKKADFIPEPVKEEKPIVEDVIDSAAEAGKSAQVAPPAAPEKQPSIEPRSSFVNNDNNKQSSSPVMSINQPAMIPQKSETKIETKPDAAPTPFAPFATAVAASPFAAAIASPAPAPAPTSSAPPPPPPTRKVHTDFADSPPKRDRRDIQSKLFTNLTTADIMEQGNGAGSDRLSFIGENSTPPLPRNAGTTINEAHRRHDSGMSNSIMNHSDNRSSISLANSHMTISRTGNRFVHPDLNSIGLNASVSESIKAVIRDGQTETCQIIGEVALTYYKPPLGQLPIGSYLKLVDNDHSIERLIPNHSFLEQVAKNSLETVFKLNCSQISSRTLGGLKYLVPKAVSPVNIIPVWRFEPHQASCMIGIKLSDAVMNKLYGSSVSLDGLVLSIALEEGVEIKSAMSRPSGTFNKEKRRITWKFTEPVVLSSSHPEEKIVARFLTNGTGKESKSGAQAKFVINSQKGGEIVVSDIGLQYASDNTTLELGDVKKWEEVNVVKTFSTNVFSAHSV